MAAKGWMKSNARHHSKEKRLLLTRKISAKQGLCSTEADWKRGTLSSPLSGLSKMDQVSSCQEFTVFD